MMEQRVLWNSPGKWIEWQTNALSDYIFIWYCKWASFICLCLFDFDKTFIVELLISNLITAHFVFFRFNEWLNHRLQKWNEVDAIISTFGFLLLNYAFRVCSECFRQFFGLKSNEFSSWILKHLNIYWTAFDASYFDRKKH